jgi:hypothetical protein
MAIVNDRRLLENALGAVAAVRSHANTLAALSGTVSFDVIRNAVDQMSLPYDRHVVPLLAFPEADVNAAMARQFPLGAPANTYTALALVGTTLATFKTAYKALYDTAGNVMSYTTAGGHAFVTIQVSALSSLATPLTNLRNACAALEVTG